MAPLISAGLLLQLLAGVRVIDVNMQSKEDRELFQAAQKVLGLSFTFVQAVICVVSGMYGPLEQL